MVSYSLHMLDVRRRLREVEAARVAPPPVVPALPRMVTDPAEPFVPAKVRAVITHCAKHGWKYRLYRAVAPWISATGKASDEQVPTLTIAAQGPAGQRIVFTWRWVTRTDGSTDWQPVGAQDWRTGQLMTLTEGKARMIS